MRGFTRTKSLNRFKPEVDNSACLMQNLTRPGRSRPAEISDWLTRDPSSGTGWTHIIYSATDKCRRLSVLCPWWMSLWCYYQYCSLLVANLGLVSNGYLSNGTGMCARQLTLRADPLVVSQVSASVFKSYNIRSSPPQKSTNTLISASFRLNLQ